MSERPGRNDPCHCGSGLKYKKCHLPQDEAAARTEAAQAAPETEAAPAQAAAPISDGPGAPLGNRPLLLGLIGIGIIGGVITGFVATPQLGVAVAGAGLLGALLYAGLRHPPPPNENPGDPAALNFGNSTDAPQVDVEEQGPGRFNSGGRPTHQPRGRRAARR